MTFERKRKDQNYEVAQGKRTATKKDKAQICLWIDAEQYRLLKIDVATKGKTITEIVSKSINLYLSKTR